MGRRGGFFSRFVAGLKLLVIDLLSLFFFFIAWGLILLVGAFDKGAAMIFGIIFILLLLPLSFWIKGWIAEAVWGWR